MLKFISIKRVDRNINPPHASAIKIIRHFMQLAAIGGDGNFIKVATANFSTQIFDQMHDVTAHQRLSACQPDLARANSHKAAAHHFQFFKGQ